MTSFIDPSPVDSTHNLPPAFRAVLPLRVDVVSYITPAIGPDDSVHEFIHPNQRCAPPYPDQLPSIRFLFIGPVLCLRLPSVCTSRFTPCRSASSSSYQENTGLAPARRAPGMAHAKKWKTDESVFHDTYYSRRKFYFIRIIRRVWLSVSVLRV